MGSKQKRIEELTWQVTRAESALSREVTRRKARERADREQGEAVLRRVSAEARRKRLADLAVGLVPTKDADVSFHHEKGESKTAVTIELSLDAEEEKAFRRSVDARGSLGVSDRIIGDYFTPKFLFSATGR